MGRYSVIEPDQKIIDQLTGSRSVIIVGCSNCANISIGRDKNLPIFQLTNDERTRKRTSKPVAIVKEAERLKVLLEGHGIKAGIEVHPFYCGSLESIDAGILEPLGYPPDLKDSDVDAVLALTCMGEGLMGVKRTVRDGVKVVAGMRSVGGHEPVLSFDVGSGYVYVEEDKSVFTRRE